MKRDHFGFAVFIILLLLVPKLPIDLGNAAPERSSLGLGAVGLVFWFLILKDRFTDKKSFFIVQRFSVLFRIIYSVHFNCIPAMDKCALRVPIFFLHHL